MWKRAAWPSWRSCYYWVFTPPTNCPTAEAMLTAGAGAKKSNWLRAYANVFRWLAEPSMKAGMGGAITPDTIINPPKYVWEPPKEFDWAKWGERQFAREGPAAPNRRPDRRAHGAVVGQRHRCRLREGGQGRRLAVHRLHGRCARHGPRPAGDQLIEQCRAAQRQGFHRDSRPDLRGCPGRSPLRLLRQRQNPQARNAPARPPPGDHPAYALSRLFRLRQRIHRPAGHPRLLESQGQFPPPG